MTKLSFLSTILAASAALFTACADAPTADGTFEVTSAEVVDGHAVFTVIAPSGDLLVHDVDLTPRPDAHLLPNACYDVAGYRDGNCVTRVNVCNDADGGGWACLIENCNNGGVSTEDAFCLNY